MIRSLSVNSSEKEEKNVGERRALERRKEEEKTITFFSFPLASVPLRLPLQGRARLCTRSAQAMLRGPSRDIPGAQLALGERSERANSFFFSLRDCAIDVEKGEKLV